MSKIFDVYDSTVFSEMKSAAATERFEAARVPDPLGNGVPCLQAYDAPAEESDERLLLAWHDFAVEPAT